jgi:hypothetical protein
MEPYLPYTAKTASRAGLIAAVDLMVVAARKRHGEPG